MKLLPKPTYLVALLSTVLWFGQPAKAQEARPDTTNQNELQVVNIDSAFIDTTLVRTRLGQIEKTIPLTYNSISHQFVEYFAFRKPHFTKAMLEKMNIYFPLYEEYLRKYNLPDELKYLSMIESALNPKAISYAKAGGLWQFMPRTAKIDFGLRMDEYVDERFDPVRSTEAACRYMTQLYKIFGDWELVLAAYNTGPGNVKRAQRRAGGGGFWEIYNYLHKQTRGYVPQYVGIVYMMHHAQDHDIFPETLEKTYEYDTLHVNSFLDLERFALFSNVSLESIQALNPHILTKILPGHTRNFALRVPKGSYESIVANRQMIMDSASKLPTYTAAMLANRGQAVDSTGQLIATLGDLEDEVLNKKVKKTFYKVRRGETLSRIAQRFNVDVYDLKVWNRIRKNNALQAGQKLVVYREVRVSAQQQAQVAKSLKKFKPKYVTVQRGDTLWSISQRYGGVSVEKIKKLNGIRGNNLKAGQKIRLS